MNSRKIAGGLVAATATLVAGMFAGGPANATATATAGMDNSDRASSAVSRTLTTSGETATYWTPQRMENAVPGTVLAEKAKANSMARATTSERSSVDRGQHVAIKGKKGNSKPSQPTAGNEAPVKHIGKVFFTLGGTDYVCSGNSVASTNESTVSTAGHCVNEGPGNFATQWIFVPAYENGSAPYGKWTAEELFAPTEWSNQGNMAYDTGFAVLAPLNGQNLSDVVGASGVEFNAARGQNYTAYGYPAAAPFDGATLKSCQGTATNDPYNPAFETQGIPCDMTGGSSGGPWFLNSGSAGMQNSINSYGYGGLNKMFGPYWGNVINNVYNGAANS